MKQYHFSFLLLLCVTSIHSQAWLDSLPDKPRQTLTFFDYQNAFNAYWAPYQVEDGYYTVNGEKIKASGWKPFKRWEYMMQSRIDPKTGALPEQTPFQIVNDYYQTHTLPRDLPVSDWKSIGPFTSLGGYQGIGRINCVAFHPTDLMTLWAGAASGGLWVTHDGGNSWTCLTDKTESLGLNDIIIPADYETSQTIYIATGDKDSFDNNSVGVLKSTDGGQTWAPTGLSFALKDRKQVNRLLQHPQHPDTIIAATTDAVYRTTDGGVTWDETLIDQFFIDMEMHPSDPDVIYGSTFDGEIFVTSNGGQQWTKTLHDLSAARTELAVSPDEPDWVYAVTATGYLKGIYKSTDLGATFTKVLDGATLNLLSYNADGSGTTGQGSYDLTIAASPLDAQTIVVGGINTWRSTDGGLQWHLISHWAAGDVVPIVHADKHQLRYRPNGDLWECNDGGLYVSFDQGITWHDKTNGMAISQMYKMGSSATEKDEIITGLQDNGSKVHQATGWITVIGADGTESMIDPVDHRIQYSSSQSGNLFRTLDHWETITYIKPQAAGAGLWVTPYLIDPARPNILYGGFREIWKSENRGTTWTQVSQINSLPKIKCMAAAPSNTDIVYFAEAGRMWRTTDAGVTFDPVSVIDVKGLISGIAVKHDDPETVWVSCGSFINPGVYETTNAGQDWTDISDGLPPIPVNVIVQNKQSTEEIELYAGTDLGVYVKKGSAPWLPFHQGLPNAIVTDMELYYASDPTLTLLRASTYGRGLWETRVGFNSAPMEFVSANTTQMNTSFVLPGETETEVIRLEIHTLGDLDPLHVSSITFSTEGSTQPEKDLIRARAYYTGSINGFLTTIPFGEAVAQPDGTFIIEGHQALQNGPNYFWLAYDVSQDATLGHVIDGACLSVDLDQPVTPDIISPEGHRVIELVYCDAGSTNVIGEYIRRVVLGDLDITSMKGVGGYEDHTAHVTELTSGESTPIAVENNSPHTSNELRIWADWNQDADFDDVDEDVYASGPLGITTYMTHVVVPDMAKPGLVRLRLRLHDRNFGPNDTPCGNSNLGEVEDYVIRVTDSTSGTEFSSPDMAIHVFPNPVHDELTLEATGTVPSVTYKIFDTLGRPLTQGTFTLRTTISTISFAEDMYLLQCIINEQIIWKKIIKLAK